MNVLCCFGDSITYGEFVSTEETWTTLLRERFPDLRVRNRGVCGDTTRLALERWRRDVVDCSPDQLLVQFGHNDANHWDGFPRVSQRAFAANLWEIVARAIRLGIADVALIEPHGEHRYADVMWEVAQELDIPYITTAAVRPEHLLDGIHLNPEGHRVYADLVGEEIAKWQSPLLAL